MAHADVFLVTVDLHDGRTEYDWPAFNLIN